MIPAVVFDGTAAEAELWRIYENLARKELTSLERSERIARAVTLVDEKRRSAQVAQSQHPNDKAISATSRALGIDRRRVQRSLRIAGLSDEAKTVATDLGLADNQRVLSNAASSAVTPEEQVDFLKQTAARLKLRPPREQSEQEKPAIEHAKATSIENSRRLREQTHRAATFLLERLGEPNARELLEMVDNIGLLAWRRSWTGFGSFSVAVPDGRGWRPRPAALTISSASWGCQRLPKGGRNGLQERSNGVGGRPL